MEIIGGGPDAPVIQRVTTGDVEFGVTNADDVLIARSQGAPVVALMAPYQVNPRCIMVHEESRIESIEDINDKCAELGARPVQVRSADQVHNELRPLLQQAGYDLTRHSGVPLGYDYEEANLYQTLDQLRPHVSVQEVFQALRDEYGYTGDHHTNQLQGGQRLAGFGWGEAPATSCPNASPFRNTRAWIPSEPSVGARPVVT